MYKLMVLAFRKMIGCFQPNNSLENTAYFQGITCIGLYHIGLLLLDDVGQPTPCCEVEQPMMKPLG